MRQRRIVHLAAVLAGLATWLAIATPAVAGASVYLMRGLADVSTGLDELAAKLKRRGITAIVDGHMAWQGMAERAAQDYKTKGRQPIVIIGHSLGADAAISMAETLGSAGIPVALIVAFSPATSAVVPRNVARLTSYYQSNSYWNSTYQRAKGSSTSVRNVDLAKDASIHHFNIEKVERLHASTIASILGLGGGKPAAQGSAATGAAP